MSKNLIIKLLITFSIVFISSGCQLDFKVGMEKVAGAIVKGPISKATIKVRDMAGNLLDTTISDENGNYEVNIGTYTGIVRVSSTGGSYIDEITGLEVDASGFTLESISMVGGEYSEALYVTPFTTMAADQILELYKQGDNNISQKDIEDINKQIAIYITGEAFDITKVGPESFGLGEMSDTIEGRYSIFLATFAAITQGKPNQVHDMMKQLLAEFKTGKRGSMLISMDKALENNEKLKKYVSPAMRKKIRQRIEAYFNIDTTPDPINDILKENQKRNSKTQFDVVIKGLDNNAITHIAINNKNIKFQVSDDNGATFRSSLFAKNNSIIRVIITNSSNFNTTTSVVLNVGGVIATLTSKTNIETTTTVSSNHKLIFVKNKSYSIDISQYFQDADGDTLVFTHTKGSLPAGINFSNHQLTGTPTSNGSTSIEITATDKHNAKVSLTFNVQVVSQPVVSSVQAPLNTRLKSGSNAVITIKFSESVDIVKSGTFVVVLSTGSQLRITLNEGLIEQDVGIALSLTAGGGDYNNVTITSISTDATITGRTTEQDFLSTDGQTVENLIIDNTLPTLTITDDIPGTLNPDQNITFTFTFSEEVAGFKVNDIGITGGSKGIFSGDDNSTTYTLVVIPNSNFEGNITIDVPVNSAQDMAGNGNAQAQKTQVVQVIGDLKYILSSKDGLYFDSVLDTFDYVLYADINNSTSISALTVGMWIKPEDTTKQKQIISSLEDIFELKIDNTDKRIELLDKTNSENNVLATSNDSIKFGKWQYISLTISNTDVTIYINGISKATVRWSSFNMGSGGDSFYIASNTADTYYKGRIKDVGLYFSALSDVEIKELMFGNYNNNSNLKSKASLDVSNIVIEDTKIRVKTQNNDYFEVGSIGSVLNNYNNKEIDVSDSNATFTFIFERNVTNFKTADINVTNGTIIPSTLTGSGTTYSVDVQPIVNLDGNITAHYAPNNSLSKSVSVNSNKLRIVFNNQENKYYSQIPSSDTRIFDSIKVKSNLSNIAYISSENGVVVDNNGSISFRTQVEPTLKNRYFVEINATNNNDKQGRALIAIDIYHKSTSANLNLTNSLNNDVNWSINNNTFISGDMTANQQSCLEVNSTNYGRFNGSTISIITDIENHYDLFKFYINDKEMMRVSNRKNLYIPSIPFKHNSILKFCYIKDSVIDDGQDNVTITTMTDLWTAYFAPIFKRDFYIFNVNNTSIDTNTSVGVVDAFDNVASDTITYYIDSSFGNDANKFNINRSTGEISFKNLNNRTEFSAYTLKVIASDGVNKVTSPPIYINVKSNSISHYNIEYKKVKSAITSKIWLDRNLGASKSCTKSRRDFDTYESYKTSQKDCFGDYYQWGRENDGHQIKSSSAIDYESSQSYIGDNFITVLDNSHNDWKHILDANGTNRKLNWDNSICPTGFKIPTVQEIAAELNSTNEYKDVMYNNILKFPIAGYRDGSNADVVEDNFKIWTTEISPNNNYSKNIAFNKDIIGLYEENSGRSNGYTVRCIENN
ncbi:Fibronectin type III domain protein [hydrothermal vent metagenome]|uniref:Fibronectin type III domain protein n=1 Tax=hydrothermal vent metagenome TaxID=652676 RepID=A0A3B1E5T7_9ZZZZ